MSYLSYSHLYNQAERYLESLGPRQWVMILGALIVVGLICCRGFGSRSNY